MQSVLASMGLRRREVLRRAAAVLAGSQPLLLDCGDGVRLQAFHAAPPRMRGDPVVLLHGWEGSADSLYMLSLAAELHAQGFGIVRLNLRDHGGTHHLNQGLFHSCLLDEAVGAVRALNAQFAGRPLQLVGFSLGGNFMLRVAAVAPAAGLAVSRAVAISPVLDPAQTLTALEDGWFGYHVYFVRKWSGSLLRKQAAWPEHYDFATARLRGGLREMTGELVRRYTDFPTLEDYLNGYAITGLRLAGLRVPSLLLTALDDPIIPAHGLERLARPEALELCVTRRGGHVGFLDRLQGPTWADRFLTARLVAARDG